MAPKSRPRKGGVGSLLEIDVLSGDLAQLLPFYNVGTVYEPVKSRRGREGAKDPTALPVFDQKALEKEIHSKCVLGSTLGAAAFPARDPVTGPYVGLMNVGSTCYVNSLLQYLFVNVAFRKRVLAQETTDKVLGSLQKLFGLMQQTTDSVCDPSHFVDSAGITRGVQEDVTEFWNMLVDHLNKHTKGSIRELVAFKQATVIQCSGCNRASSNDESFFELHVKPPADIGSAPAVVNSETVTSSKVKPPADTGSAPAVVSSETVTSSKASQPESSLSGQWTMTDQDKKIYRYEWVHDAEAATFDGFSIQGVQKVGIQDGSVDGTGISWRMGETICRATLSSSGRELREGSFGHRDGGDRIKFTGKKKKVAGAKEKLGAVNLEDAIRSAFIPETLSGENAYACEACGGRQEASRRNTLQSLPPFLHIIFDRFSWDLETGQRKRICCEIEFPEVMSFGDLISPTPDNPNALDSDWKFQLIGVLDHHSTTAESGHYTATLKNPGYDGDVQTWWEFNDTRVATEGIEPGVATAEGLNGGRSWLSKSAYMLIYRSQAEASSSHEYARPSGPVALPASISEEVTKKTEEHEGFMRNLAKNVVKHKDLLNRRANLVHTIQAQFDVEGAAPMPKAKDMTVVPTKWLQSFLLGAETSPEKGGMVEINYSTILLPALAGGSRRRLDPFAMWDGRAKVVPTEMLKSGFLECLNHRSLDKLKILPSELSLEDLALETLMCPKTVRILHALLSCTQHLATLLVKMRTGQPRTLPDDLAPPKSIVWIWSSSIQKILAKYPKMAIPVMGKKFTVTEDNTRDQLAVEWKAFEKNFHSFESSGKKPGSGAAAGVPDLNGNIRCEHDQLTPRLKAINVFQEDIDTLRKLEDERARLWQEYGARGAASRVAAGEYLPETARECELCKGIKLHHAEFQKTRKVEMKAMCSKFPVLEKGRHQLDRSSPLPQLQVGSYLLIPAEWRNKWLSHVTNPDAAEPPPLDPGVLRCEHGSLRYNPAEYFENGRDAYGELKDEHPHQDAYILVPRKEGEALYEDFTAKGSQGVAPIASWCSLDCKRIPEPDGIADRIFTCSPTPCEICTGDKASYTLTVKLETEMPLEYDQGRQVEVAPEVTGLEVKDKILAEFAFADIVAGQLLLSINGTSFGDSDSLRKALGAKAFIPHASLTVEILDFVMSEPSPAKRPRSSLIGCNLGK